MESVAKNASPNTSARLADVDHRHSDVCAPSLYYRSGFDLPNAGTMTLFFSIVTLFLSVAVAVIAWQQWRVADNRLRLDLFDRRYKVYDATRKFLATILRDANFTDSQLFEFYAGTSDAEFLFGADVTEHLEKIRKRAVHLQTAQKIYDPLPVGEERSKHVQAAHDDLLWLTDQITSISKTFAPYLGFTNVRLRVWPSLKPFSANR